MKNSFATRDVHLDDGALIRRLDGEISGDERSLNNRHLESCAHCATRLETLRALSDVVSQQLAAADRATYDHKSGLPVAHGNRPRRRHFSWRRAAAIAALIPLTATLTITPVRAWLVHQSRSLLALVGIASQQTEDARTPQPESSVFFSLNGSTSFSIWVEREQTSGNVSVITAKTDMVSATIMGGAASEVFVIEPGKLTIANDGCSTASYRIEVPASLAEITIEIGDGSVMPLEPRSLEQGLEIPLRGAGGSEGVRNCVTGSLE